MPPGTVACGGERVGRSRTVLLPWWSMGALVHEWRQVNMGAAR